jgi:hypothetical protein
LDSRLQRSYRSVAEIAPRTGLRIGVAAGAVLSLVAGVPAAHALDPAVEAKDCSKTQERTRIFSTPQYQAQLAQVSAQNFADALQIQARDPEREFVTDGCWSYGRICARDVRLNDWQAKATGSWRPCSSRRGTAAPSPATSGPRARDPRSGR